MKINLLSLIFIASTLPINAKTCKVTFENDQSVTLPVAKKTADQVRGLSGNNTDQGLIMAWDTAEYRAVWMRETHSPLTALFIGPDGVIQSIQDMQPNTDTAHSSLHPTIAIIELKHEIWKKLTLIRGERVISSECFPLPKKL
jgi:uncharacterized membrane protein (UPF0127 family)